MYNEEEMNVKMAELESLKETVKQKEYMLIMANAKIASLEEEGIRKMNELEKTDRVFEKMEQRLKKVEDPKYKRELNARTKEIKNLNQKLADNLKKFREETNLRAKAEAEVKMKDSTIDTLKEIIAKQKSSIQEAEPVRPSSPQGSGGSGLADKNELCRDFQRQGNCFRGSSCKFIHLPQGRTEASFQPASSGKPDCIYWKEGYCRKAENQCRGKHNPSIFGTQPKQLAQSGGNTFNNTNFVESLAKAVSQSLVGAQQQMANDPSRGQHMGGTQPQQQTLSNQQVNTQQQQHMTNNQQHTMMNQQQHMIPMMMLPNSQSMFFPAQQGRQGLGQ